MTNNQVYFTTEELRVLVEQLGAGDAVLFCNMKEAQRRVEVYPGDEFFKREAIRAERKYEAHNLAFRLCTRRLAEKLVEQELAE